VLRRHEAVQQGRGFVPLLLVMRNGAWLASRICAVLAWS